MKAKNRLIVPCEYISQPLSEPLPKLVHDFVTIGISNAEILSPIGLAYVSDWGRNAEALINFDLIVVALTHVEESYSMEEFLIEAISACKDCSNSASDRNKLSAILYSFDIFLQKGLDSHTNSKEDAFPICGEVDDFSISKMVSELIDYFVYRGKLSDNIIDVNNMSVEDARKEFKFKYPTISDETIDFAIDAGNRLRVFEIDCFGEVLKSRFERVRMSSSSECNLEYAAVFTDLKAEVEEIVSEMGLKLTGSILQDSFKTCQMEATCEDGIELLIYAALEMVNELRAVLPEFEIDLDGDNEPYGFDLGRY